MPADEIAAQEYNLNIRRYVDNSPDPEPHDVTAHLSGGVPTAEVSAQELIFARYSLQDSVIFDTRDTRYYDFIPDITKKEDIREIIGTNPDVHDVEETIRSALSSWISVHNPRISSRYETHDLFSIRKEFLISLERNPHSDRGPGLVPGSRDLCELVGRLPV